MHSDALALERKRERARERGRRRGAKRTRGSQRGRTDRPASPAKASQSPGGELAHRSSAIYASGRLKNTRATRRGGDGGGGSVLISAGCTSRRTDRRTARGYRYPPIDLPVSLPPLPPFPRLTRLFSVVCVSPPQSLPRALVYSCSRLIHIYCIPGSPFAPIQAADLGSPRMRNERRGEVGPFGTRAMIIAAT